MNKPNFKKFDHNMNDDTKAGWLYALGQILFNGKGVARLGAITEKNQDNKRVLKKSRKTGEPVPEHLKTIYTFQWFNVAIGHKYSKLVNNLLEKAGLEPNFESGSSYDEPYLDSKVVFKHKTKDVFYFRVYPDACEQFNPVYKYFDANFNEIPEAEYKEIKEEYLAKSSKSLVEVRNYKMESVYVVIYGTEFNKVTNEDFLKLLEMLKEKKK